MKVTDTIKYVGVNDHNIDLFEGQYKVPNGMSYNSYVILDEKVAVMDTVDAEFTHQWLDNIQQVLEGRKPDYLIVQHMEPDHAANIANFLKVYPDTTVVATGKAMNMIHNFFELDLEGKKIEMENAVKPQYIETIWGVGYRFKAQEIEKLNLPVSSLYYHFILVYNDGV